MVKPQLLDNERRLGATFQSDDVIFRVWAPRLESLELIFEGLPDHPFQMNRTDGGHFEVCLEGVKPASRYYFRDKNGRCLPDPASRFQPIGVHGPSQVVDLKQFRWSDDAWNGVDERVLVLYELHLGTWTRQGSFLEAIQTLSYLKDLGISAIELMPVAEFAGRWNWGYDTSYLFAPFHGYGTPAEFQQLVDAAHRAGLGVVLDVVYNHLGPDGCFYQEFAPFLTNKHSSPWGQGINLDDEHSSGVRNFFIENALYWLSEFHLDGLRLDATQAMLDDSEEHFLAELSRAVERLPGPKRHLFAEDSRRWSDVVRPRSENGLGLSGVWSDDFHHLVRNYSTGDTESYFADFAGADAKKIATTIRQGWFFTGKETTPRGIPRGTPTEGVPLHRFVFCIQNHDQVGNRPDAMRLHHEISWSLYRTWTAILLFAPETPLLFMGQEWAAETRFFYFSDHHEELGKLVTEGRRLEYDGWNGFHGDLADPQSPSAFWQSKLNWEEIHDHRHAGMINFYRDLLQLRRRLDGDLHVEAHNEHCLVIRRGSHWLFASLRDDESILAVPATKEILHSEHPSYTMDGQPPRVQDGSLYFPKAAAWIAESNSYQRLS